MLKPSKYLLRNGGIYTIKSLPQYSMRLNFVFTSLLVHSAVKPVDSVVLDLFQKRERTTMLFETTSPVMDESKKLP